MTEGLEMSGGGSGASSELLPTVSSNPTSRWLEVALDRVESKVAVGQSD